MNCSRIVYSRSQFASRGRGGGGAPGKLRDVPVCVRQMCGQMGHIWMLCVLGHICPSSSCSPMEREMAEGRSKKREIPSLHRRCKWSRTTPSPRWPGCPGTSEAAVPKDRGDEVLLILFVLFTRFRSKMTAAGFTISGKDHPICPVMLGDARLAAVMAEDMLNRGEPGRELWAQTRASREGTASGGTTTVLPPEDVPA